jgi:plasmid stability protein
MPINITIRNIPQEVRDELAGRAALEGKSMQEYLRSELIKLATSPNVTDWVNAVAERKAHYGSRVSATKILKARDADRR